MKWRLLGIMISVALASTMLGVQRASAGNNWAIGNIVGLCQGTHIRTGPGYKYSYHTIVPENNWAVKVINGPYHADGQTWWDTSRKDAGDPSGGTGLVAQSEADQCYSSPLPQPTSPPAPAPTPQLPPTPTPPLPLPTSCANGVGYPIQNYRSPRAWADDKWYMQYAAGLEIQYLCKDSVVFGLADATKPENVNISYPGGELRFDNQLHLTGYTLSYADIAPGRSLLPSFSEDRDSIYWSYDRKKTDVTMAQGYPYRILQLSGSSEVRYGYRPRPPNFSWDLAYQQLSVMADFSAARSGFIARGFSNPGGLSILLMLLMSIAGLEMMVNDAQFSSSQADRTAAAGSTVADSMLVDILRQSYGPLADSAKLMPMELNQTYVLASNPQVQLNAKTSITEPVLPAVSYTANGFTPNSDILVVMDRAGSPHVITSVLSSDTGYISGSIVLSDTDATTPGTLTLAAVEKQAISDGLQTLNNDSTALVGLPMAASAITVQPAPRLMSSVVFDPWPIVAGRWTTATYTVRNVGDVPISLKYLSLAVRGPDCSSWCDEKMADWPGITDTLIYPGLTRTVNTRRIIDLPGQYMAVVSYEDANSVWHDADASSSFQFTVQPGIVIQEPLTMTPTDPLAGEMVTFRFRIHNASTERLTLWNVLAAGRGPNCVNGWDCTSYGDVPGVRNVQLDAGQDYAYEQSRLFAGQGSYFIQPLFQFTQGDWHLLDSRKDFLVRPGIQIARSLQLSPLEPVAGQSIRTTYTLHNGGYRSITLPYLGVASRGPNCEGLGTDCSGSLDWPWIGNVTLDAGSDYTFTSTRGMEAAGTGYWAEPQIADWNPIWQMADGGRRVTFPVLPGLTVSGPISLDPAQPVAGQLVRTVATIRNDSGRILNIDHLLVGVRGPGCQGFSCADDDVSKYADFPITTGLTLAPGASFHYEGARTFSQEGSNYIYQVSYGFDPQQWLLLGKSQSTTVGRGLVLAQPVTLNPSTPVAGEPVTASYALRNDSNLTLTLDSTGVASEGPDCYGFGCSNDDATKWADFPHFENVTFKPGETRWFTSGRTFFSAGSEYFVQTWFRATANDWNRIGGMSFFTVGRGLEVQSGLAIHPNNPIAGVPVSSSYTLHNYSARSILVRALAVGGRAIDCDPAHCLDDAGYAAVENVAIPAGGTFTYSQSRSFTRATDYFIEPNMLINNEGWWAPISAAQRLTFTVLPGLALAGPITLDPANPVAGQLVTATVNIRNDGNSTLNINHLSVGVQGPDCLVFGCSTTDPTKWADFPETTSLTLAPHATFHYQASRSFVYPGDNYVYQVWYGFDRQQWLNMSQPQHFSVKTGLLLAQPLTLDPPNPVAGQMVKAYYTLQNTSGRPLTIHSTGVASEGPGCLDFGCSDSAPEKFSDYPHFENITLSPGESRQFTSERMFLTPGDQYFAQVWFRAGPDDWNRLGSSHYFTVEHGLEIVKKLHISPSEPVIGQPYTGTYSVYNASDRALIIPGIGVGGQAVNCADQLCANGAGMTAYFTVTVPPGERYDYIASNTMDKIGDYYIQPSIILAWGPPDWWTPVTMLTNGQRITFTVAGDPSLPLVLPPCSISINRGAASTNQREVSVSINVPGATRLLVSNDDGFSDSKWVVYQHAFSWTLPEVSQQPATLVVRVRAYSGDIMLCNADLNDGIIFDSVPPTLLIAWGHSDEKSFLRDSTSGLATTGILTVTSSDGNGSGVSEMEVSGRTDFSGVIWEPYQQTQVIYGEKSGLLYVRVRDRAGNASAVVSVKIADRKQVYMPLILEQ